MNGNQGLDALAALCGGASKAVTADDREQSNNYMITTNHETTSEAPPATQAQPLPVVAPSPAAISIPSNSPGQQWLQCLSSSYAGAPTPMAPDASFPGMLSAYNVGGSSNNPVAAFQQWMYSLQGQYQALFQAQASQLAQQYAQQQQRPRIVPPTGAAIHSNMMDPATLASMAKAFGSQHNKLQQQQQQQPNNVHQADASTSNSHELESQGSALKSSMTISIASTSSGVGEDLASSQMSAVSESEDKKHSNASQSVTFEPSQSSNTKAGVPKSERKQETFSESSTSNPSVPFVRTEEKKELKRAANRRSAQLSRKRKKHFIEELKEENDDLRRKEQILRSIPDLIVMFDSAGRLGFVSHSVSNFLDFKPSDLEGTSFWQRLCDESVRLLKAAFMDALASRTPEMQTAPLGDGLWELRLKDKDGMQKFVTLNGVVHFSGEMPECVCSIRPKDEGPASKVNNQGGTCTGGRMASEDAHLSRPGVIIKPQQSVISSVTDDSSSAITADLKGSRIARPAAQISDGESISETASDRS